jgi:hypothetical protein
MKLKRLLSLMSFQQRSENPEQALLISRRLKDVLQNTEAGNAPDIKRSACSCQDDQHLVSERSFRTHSG